MTFSLCYFWRASSHTQLLTWIFIHLPSSKIIIFLHRCFYDFLLLWCSCVLIVLLLFKRRSNRGCHFINAQKSSLIWRGRQPISFDPLNLELKNNLYLSKCFWRAAPVMKCITDFLESIPEKRFRNDRDGHTSSCSENLKVPYENGRSWRFYVNDVNNFKLISKTTW